MKWTQKWISALSAALLFCMPLSAKNAADISTADTSAADMYTIQVNGQYIDLSNLPMHPYEKDGVFMVPLRIIGEALGYTVAWDPVSQAITIDDGIVQKATLYDGTASVVFEGELQVIDMSRTVENAVPTVVYEGFTYVPLEFFQEFFNETAVMDTVITIAPQMCELDNET